MPRRALLGLGAAAVASALAGCGRAIRHAGGSPATTPAATPTGSVAGSSGVGSSTVVPAPAASPAGPAEEVASGPATRPQIALTFHGAGDPAIARDLLAIFAAHRARVTVLAVGSWLAANPELGGEITSAGHELGNHTYNHLDIDNLDEASARAEIVRCRDLLISVVGSPGRHFRPSQTQHASPLVRRLAGAAGYPVCLSYNVDSLDYTDPGADVVRANLARAAAGSIVSMHFGHAGTVAAMPGILADLDARGLQPVTVERLLRP